MIISFHPSATSEQIDAVRNKLLRASDKLHLEVLIGEEKTVLAAIGDASMVNDLGLEGMNGVEHVFPISSPYKLASLEAAKDQKNTIFTIGDKQIGGDKFALIAGPCTVESRDQAIEAAKACAEGGASMIRAGIFKPRTSPFAFQGPGLNGLEVLAEIKQETGLPVVSELTEIEHAEALAGVADVIQIGARNMQNYALLQVAGRLSNPILLKRGLSSKLDELLMAADYILKEGNPQVILCERGIRTFETATRFTLDIAAVPYLKENTHLPVIVDPSHAPGDRALVPALARAAAAVGADGILVEVTGDPENALCDGPQQLYSSQFSEFAERVGAHAALQGKTIS